MQLSDIYVGLGQESLPQLLRSISLGKLRTYQLFDRVKTRLHLPKLNQENLRKAAPKLFDRLSAHDEELASDLGQAILVSHLDMIIEVLNFLEVPHTDGFFEKEGDIAQKLGEGWQTRSYEHFHEKFPKEVLVFYLNHLSREVNPDAQLFQP